MNARPSKELLVPVFVRLPPNAAAFTTLVQITGPADCTPPTAYVAAFVALVVSPVAQALAFSVRL